jgi:hypothetical protein
MAEAWRRLPWTWGARAQQQRRKEALIGLPEALHRDPLYGTEKSHCRACAETAQTKNAVKLDVLNAAGQSTWASSWSGCD